MRGDGLRREGKLNLRETELTDLALGPIGQVAFQGAPHPIHRHADGTEEWMAAFSDPEGRTLAIMAQSN